MVMTEPPMTGLQLKVERTRRRVKAYRIAELMGVSRSRVAAIEREGFPSDETVARYLTALDTCAPSPTSETA